jgi:hypothetical protein
MKHVSKWRWAVVIVLALLCAYSLIDSVELFHSYHLSLVSRWGCVVLATRESDWFVPRVWLPYPVLILVAR